MKRLMILGLYISVTVVLVVLVSNLAVYFGTKDYIYSSLDEVPVSQTVLIPGAAVLKNGTPSPVFKDRVDTAIDLYRAEKVSKILVSGDNSTLEYNEVNPVRVYLIEQGIPDRDIFLDHAGFDTYSSMYRAQNIFLVSSITVTTQSFHLPRSVFIARKLGIEAYGLKADKGSMLLRNNIRELFATEKALLNLIVGRKPKFLGEKIPITYVAPAEELPDKIDEDETEENLDSEIESEVESSEEKEVPS